MKFSPIVLTTALIWGAPALSDGSTSDLAVRAALESKADLPALPPTLPDRASDQATQTLMDTAFGKRGQAVRAAHSQSSRLESTKEATRNAAAEAAGLAAKAGEAAAQAAAGQARANAVRNNPPGPPKKNSTK